MKSSEDYDDMAQYSDMDTVRPLRHEETPSWHSAGNFSEHTTHMDITAMPKEAHTPSAMAKAI